MRILVVALGSPGHSFPLVPLAVALRDAGHDVTFGLGPESLEAVSTTGLAVAQLGLSMRQAFAQAFTHQGRTETPTDEQDIADVAGEALGDVLPRALAADVGAWIVEHCPDLVVVEAGATGAHLAAIAAEVPSVTHAFGRRPDGESPMGRAITSWLSALCAERDTRPSGPGRLFGHAYLDICPPSLQAGVPASDRELPLRATAWNPPVPGFVRRPDRRPHERPWIHLTLGTAMGDAEILRTAVTGLAGLGADILLATGSVEVGELADLAGPAVQVEPFVPQADLLGSEDPPSLVVHHGGSGTTLAAAAVGAPQLVLPQGADQFGNADALVACGVARALRGRAAISAESLVVAARELLDTDGPARLAARALAGEIAAMPSPADVAARLEEWARP